MIAFLALSVAGITADVAAAEVRLRPTASCSSSVIRLADVAEVIASDSRLGPALADVMLCPAPPAGEERTLSANDVRQMLSLSGVELRDFRIQGSESVTVRFQATAGLAPANRPVMVHGVRQAVFAEERQATATGLFGGEPEHAPRMSVDELVDRLQGNDPPLLLDVRSRAAAGQGEPGIPGSIRVPLDDIDEWAEDQSRERPIVAYCT